MKTKAMLCVVAISALAGCEGMGVVKAAGCGANCGIEVVVTATATDCQITKPGKNDEYRIADGAVTDIKWTLTAPQGYDFAEPDGIWFPSPPSSTFFRKIAPNRQQFIYEDKNDRPVAKGTHVYHIKVEKGAITCKLDPTVVNE